MQCPDCQSQTVVKNGNYQLQDGSLIQDYLCETCHQRFSDKTGTPRARLRTPSTIVLIALRMRGEGMGVRASSRVLDKSHSTIRGGETRMVAQVEFWSPPAPVGSDVTLEHDELYTRVGENLPPSESEGWTLTTIERASRCWLTAEVGNIDEALFERGVKHSWQWAEPSQYIRW